MTFEGGFQGRTNKLVDGCYSFWVGALLPLIQAVQQQSSPTSTSGDYPRRVGSTTDRVFFFVVVVQILQPMNVIACSIRVNFATERAVHWLLIEFRSSSGRSRVCSTLLSSQSHRWLYRSAEDRRPVERKATIRASTTGNDFL